MGTQYSTIKTYDETEVFQCVSMENVLSANKKINVRCGWRHYYKEAYPIDVGFEFRSSQSLNKLLQEAGARIVHCKGGRLCIINPSKKTIKIDKGVVIGECSLLR